MRMGEEISYRSAVCMSDSVQLTREENHNYGSITDAAKDGSVREVIGEPCSKK